MSDHDADEKIIKLVNSAGLDDRIKIYLTRYFKLILIFFINSRADFVDKV